MLFRWIQLRMLSSERYDSCIDDLTIRYVLTWFLSAYTCSLSRQVGSACVAPTTRWYYDTTTRSCQTFTYNGCDGNSNNFVNRQECERYCGVGGCPYGGEPYREASGAIRVCNAQVTCPTGYACNTVGVGGSSLNYCCQTRGTPVASDHSRSLRNRFVL